MLKLKRVDDVIKALRIANIKRRVELTIVGSGPEEDHLKRMAANLPVSFMPPVPIERVRELMRQHDIYVFSSNGYDGWGAVVSEALSEGMRVIGSRSPGAPITLLPNECLYKEGDAEGLARLLKSDVLWVGIGQWTPENAANSLIDLILEREKHENH
jgi:glycosyltransferase involved in cell wall biosynthesis